MDDQQTIVALASMFFGAKLKGVTEAAGFNYAGAIGLSGLIQQIEKHSPTLILLDLGKDDIDFNNVVESIKTKTNTPILAFCGHVETQKLEHASAMGCFTATNGAITGNFESVLQRVFAEND